MNGSIHKFLIAFSALTLASTSAWAGNFTANNSNDDCADGVGGLQQCLDVAVDNAEADVIQLEPGNYAGNFVYNAAITAEDSPLTLKNKSTEKPVIVGGNASGLRIITSGVGDENSNVTLSGLILKKGNSGNGGGLNLSMEDADIMVQDCEFLENEGTIGAGLSIMVPDEGSANVVLARNLFSHNDAASSGGGAFVRVQAGNINLEDNTFENNSANLFEGGAANLAAESGTIHVARNILKSNSSFREGGAIHATISTGKVEVDANVFSNNSSGEAGGSFWALASDSGAAMTFTNNVISGSHAGDDEQGLGEDEDAKGGAIFVQLLATDSSVTLTHNTLTKNQSQDKGGAIAVELEIPTAQARIYNNIVFQNDAFDQGKDIYINENLSNDQVWASVEFYNNLYGDFVSYCQVEGGPCVSEGANLKNVDPLFVNAGEGDFQLSAGSPAIDKGQAAAPAMTATDLLGKARPARPDLAPDMGAFEFQPPQPDVPAPEDDSPAKDEGSVQGGCSLGSATGGSYANLSWMALSFAGLLIRRKAR